MKAILYFAVLLYSPLTAKAQHFHVDAPLDIARHVADRVADSTEFVFKYTVQPIYPDAEILDFGGNYGFEKEKVAYGLSSLFADIEMDETIEVGHTNGLKIWINDSLVYKKTIPNNLTVVFEEKSYVLPEKFVVHLKKGANRILIKSEFNNNSDNWKVILQSTNLGRYAEKGKKITCSLKNIAPEVSISNWLIIGPFGDDQSANSGINTVYPPELSIQFFKIYHSDGKPVTWNIPKVNIIAENPDGGRFYSWNYHVGCFVWGLQQLSICTGIEKYNAYASRWCDYMLSIRPLVDYQTKELHAIRSSNWSLAGRPMLDYTTAPSMPFIARLVNQKQFNNRREYQEFSENMIQYVSEKQFRMPDGVFARKYTPFPSVWVDDMFMGIPFLLYSAAYESDLQKRNSLYDDAANQIIQFNHYLFDQQFSLYRQGCYPERQEIKIPFWSRGNGWAIWATSEALLQLPANHKEYKKILKIYRNHIDGLIRYQDSEGFWHNLVNDPETVKESSGTAIFVMAMARGVNQGWLDRNKYEPSLQKGWKALLSFIDKDGNMTGVKAGTNFSPDPEDYSITPFITNDTHGLLPLLFACMEMDTYLKNKKATLSLRNN